MIWLTVWSKVLNSLIKEA